jgi:hypothetical protein
MEAHSLNLEITPKPVVVLHTASPAVDIPPTEKKPAEDVRADSRAMDLVRRPVNSKRG